MEDKEREHMLRERCDIVRGLPRPPLLPSCSTPLSSPSRHLREDPGASSQVPPSGNFPVPLHGYPTHSSNPREDPHAPSKHPKTLRRHWRSLERFRRHRRSLERLRAPSDTFNPLRTPLSALEPLRRSRRHFARSRDRSHASRRPHSSRHLPF